MRIFAVDDIKLQMPFSDAPTKALEVMATTLSSNGFRIVTRDATSIELKGPPPPQHIGETNPYWGASRIVLSHKGGTLILAAEMGQFNSTNKNAFLVAIGILLAGFFGAGAMFAFSGDAVAPMIIMAAPVSIALIASPVIKMAIHSQERRLRERFETLLNNAAMLGRNV